MANKVGRPLAFKSEKELNDKIKAYFERCEEKELPFTMSGLACWLEIDRSTLANYGKKDEYFDTIKRARMIVEASMEERMLKGDINTTGAIFSLKNNFKWTDKQEIEQKVEGVKFEFKRN